jgi:hypothetical protein
MKYIHTFWAPTEYGKSTGIPSSEVYAIVGEIFRDGHSDLTAWKMERSEAGLHHPAYGTIPREYCDEYDLFTTKSEKAYPNAQFPSNSPKHKMIAKTAKELKNLLWKTSSLSK